MILLGVFRRSPATPDCIPGRTPTRTAILLPIYNEDAARIAAGVRAVADGLADRLAGGSPGDFAFFLLSDTNDPEV